MQAHPTTPSAVTNGGSTKRDTSSFIIGGDAAKSVSSTPRPTTAARPSSASSALPTRFKTTMCRQWEQTGKCPYVTRCMFAHGARDLRTCEENIADALFTEAAVKQFQTQRAEYHAEMRRRAALMRTEGGGVTPQQTEVQFAVASKNTTVQQAKSSHSPLSSLDGESDHDRRRDDHHGDDDAHHRHGTPPAIIVSADENSVPSTRSLLRAAKVQTVRRDEARGGYHYEPYTVDVFGGDAIAASRLYLTPPPSSRCAVSGASCDDDDDNYFSGAASTARSSVCQSWDSA